MENPTPKAVDLTTAYRLLREAKVGEFAAQSAFFILLSAIPFLVFLTALLPYLPRGGEALFRLLPQEIAALLPEASPSAALLSLSAVTALWSASRGIVALTRGLNRMYGCQETRSYFLLRFFALAETLILEIALLCTLGGIIRSEEVGRLPLINRIPGGFLQTLGGWALLSAVFLLLYTLLPNRTASLPKQLPGAAGAALGWIIFTEGFSFYVNRIADFPRLYGALSNAAMLMLWLWLCLCIFFLGAFANRLLALL